MNSTSLKLVTSAVTGTRAMAVHKVYPIVRALFIASPGVATWPMTELEADDALASGAHLAARDERVQKVSIWTPDKDLAQCVVGERVVQVDRKSGQIRDEQGVMARFGVAPRFIPDYLAL